MRMLSDHKFQAVHFSTETLHDFTVLQLYLLIKKWCGMPVLS